MSTPAQLPQDGLESRYGPAGRSPWLDVDWREHQRWVPVRGTPVNTIVLGEGPAVLFIHGLAGRWANWLEQMPALAEAHRVIALDLPGFGASPLPREPISMYGYARIVDELLQALGVCDAAVVGNSMGGEIAAELAISFPQRVDSLVLVSAAGLSTAGVPAIRRALPLLRRLERPLAEGISRLASDSAHAARRPGLRRIGLRVVAEHPEQLPPALAAELMAGAGKGGFVPALQALQDHELRSRLGRIACRTLIVWGEHDRLVPVADAATFASLIEGSRTVVMRDTGHVPMLERPDAFNALLTDFLGSS